MKIENSIALVTGANRGIGKALVAALLAAGADKVYAAARNPAGLAADPRVVPLALDVTDPAQVAALTAQTGDVTLLINNAGVLEGGTLHEAGTDSLARQIAVNVEGPLAVSLALLPALARARGAIVNIASVVALAPMPALAAYSASKAALASVSASLRVTLAAEGVSVHTVFPGPVDTDMAAGITLPKTAAADVARAVLAGVAAGDAEIFPDPMAQQVAQGWYADPAAVARQFAA